MKSVVLSDAAYAALERLSADWRQPASDVLDSLLGVGPTSTSDGLLFHLLSAEFSNQRSSEARYLDLLSWIARHHRADFSDFLSRQPSAHQALLLTQEEVSAVRARHLTCQIDSTPYWAVLGLDEAVRARFDAAGFFTSAMRVARSFLTNATGNRRFAAKCSADFVCA